MWFLSHFGLETGVDFNHYALKSDLLLLTTSTHSGENEKKKGTPTKSVVKYYCMLLKYESCLIRSRCLMWERAHCVTVVSLVRERARWVTTIKQRLRRRLMIAVLYEIYLRGCRSFLSLMTFYSI